MTTAPNAPRTHPSQRPPLRMADALVRIERAINGWERLFASHERARGDERAKDESARASRTAECARALRVEAYRHRIRDAARISRRAAVDPFASRQATRRAADAASERWRTRGSR